MAASGLSDDQVNSELAKMVEFIKREADEKAKEIRIKANEEYEIEKAEIVRSEIANIDKLYEQKTKQALMQQQIQKSTAANKTRLHVLDAKAEVLDAVFQDAEAQLRQISSNEKSYEGLLVNLICQSVPLLKNESKILLTVRKADVAVAKSAADKALKKIEGGDKIEISISDTGFIDADSAGGILASTADRKIVINNSLEERLHLLGQKILPLIRLELFGPSKSRKYFD